MENDTWQLKILPALSDNYIYVLYKADQALVIDPGSTAVVDQFLSEKKISKLAILITHHHNDHTAGNLHFKERYGATIYGPKDARIAGLDKVLEEGKQKCFCLNFSVLSVPGHSCPHFAYYFEDLGFLFSGDSLFTGGCGRVFEGSFEQMYHSLIKLSKLPPDTKLYCGHEYTLSNLNFAQALESDNPKLNQRLQEVLLFRERDENTMGTPLGLELATNPFLRCSDPVLLASIGKVGKTPEEVFTYLRKAKDQF